jgi:asparagine synthase (glutamine-hydrolysing)
MPEDQHISIGQSKLRSILEENSEDAQRYKLSDVLYFEAKTFLHGLLLIEDKISMVHGVETRVPFLDQDLSSFARSLDARSLIGSFQGNLVGKLITRTSLQGFNFGNEKFKKQGFAGPDSDWFRLSMKTWLLDQLDSSQIIWEYLDYSVGMEMLTDYFEGKTNNRLFIWSLISINSSLKLFLH